MSATTSFRSSPEIVPSVVDGQHWMLEAVFGSTLENGSCSRSDERTDVTPIIEARCETEPTESHPETVQAAVNIALVMASNRERVTVIW